jgi:hypothetical protein
MKNGQGLSLEAFSRISGIRVGQLLYYCRKGRIQGAEFNRTVWQWRIYPPAKLVFR